MKVYPRQGYRDGGGCSFGRPRDPEYTVLVHSILVSRPDFPTVLAQRIATFFSGVHVALRNARSNRTQIESHVQEAP